MWCAMTISSRMSRTYCHPPTLLPWLMSPTVRFAVIGPRAAAEEATRPASERFAAIFGMMQSGWEVAMRRLPPELAELVSRPAERLAAAGLNTQRSYEHAHSAH